MFLAARIHRPHGRGAAGGSSLAVLFFLYLLVCASSLGLVSLAPLFAIATPLGDFNAYDVLLIVLLVSTLPGYLRQRRRLAWRWFRRLEWAWLLFIVLLAVQSLRSPASSLTERFVHLRFCQDYLLFFPSVALLSSGSRLRWFEVAGGAYAVLGTLLTIAQSLHGLENLFASPFYDIGAWNGNKQMVGPLARVNLPISHWVAFALIVLVGMALIRFRLWHLALGGLLSLAILINFARSLWLGLAAALALEALLLCRLGLLRGARALRLAALPAIVGVGIFLAPYVGLGGLTGALSERINEGLYFFTATAGTWSARLDQSQVALAIWQANPLWGVGTAYYEVVGTWIDMALPAVLLSIGLVGLVAEAWLLVVSSLLGLATARLGAARASASLVIIGVAVPAQVVLMMVYQQLLDSHALAVLAIATAVASVACPIKLDAGKRESGGRRARLG